MNYKLNELLTPYKEINRDSLFEPVAIGKYGIRKRCEIYKKELSNDYSKNKVIRKNTLSIGLGSNQIDVGVLTNDEIYSVSPAYNTFKIDTQKVCAKYLELSMKYNNAYFFKKHSIATARQGMDVIKKVTSIEDKIQKEKEQLNYFNELIKSRFNEMFGDPIDNIHKFDLDYLKNLGFLSRGKSKHRPRNDPQLLGGPYPLIQTGDVKNAGLYIKHYDSTYSEFGLLQSKLWPKGTLCITIAANIAETAILDFDACFPDSIVGFLPNKRANTIFIRYQIEALKDVLNSKATEVAQKNLNLEKLESVFFMVPPIILQNEFASLVEQVDKLKFNCQQRIKLYQELLDKKMDEYFS